MVDIDVTADEVASGVMTAEHVATAVEALRTDGFVILNDIVDTAHLDVLHERMLADLVALQERPDAPYNWHPGNVQQDPPPFPPYLFRDVLVNDMVICVTKAVLGPGIKNVMYGGNNALPSDKRQPVHVDTGHLWPANVLECAHPPAQLVINVLTVDVSPANGSTEIWPGTHRDLSIGAGDDIKIDPETVEKRRAEAPPIQSTFRRGSALIRDIRLWHAGMPNRTDEPRPMIAMIHSCGWMETGLPLRFPRGTEDFLAHPELTQAAQYVDEPIDHIHATHGFQYEPDSA